MTNISVGVEQLLSQVSDCAEIIAKVSNRLYLILLPVSIIFVLKDCYQ